MADTKISALTDGVAAQAADQVAAVRGGANVRVPLGTLPAGVAATDYIRFPATQVPSAGANDLDDYEEGTFTPGLTFGGGSTGMTFSTQSGEYTKIGNRCFFSLSLALSAKGSSTGQAVITGLPFTVNAAVPAAGAAIRAGFLASTTGGIMAQVIGGTTTIHISQSNTGTATSLTDANLTGTASFNLSGHYKVA